MRIGKFIMYFFLFLINVDAQLTAGMASPSQVDLYSDDPANVLNPTWTVTSGTWDCTISSYNGEMKFASFGSATTLESYSTSSYYRSIRISGSDSDINTVLSDVTYRAREIIVMDTFTPVVTDYLEAVCNDGTTTYQTENIIGINGGWIPLCTAGTECTNGQGNCNPRDATCTCYYPYYGTDCELIDCGWCHNGGTCDTSTGICTCLTGYYGDYCEYAYCPKGLSATNCNNQGYCDQFSAVCKCFDGYYSENCVKKRCLNDCNSNGRCSTSTGTCTCYDGYFGQDCAYKSCPRDCGAYGGCNLSTGECNCYGTFTEADCMFSSCPNDCNSQGVCNYYSGLCECDDGYAGVDCSLVQA